MARRHCRRQYGPLKQKLLVSRTDNARPYHTAAANRLAIHVRDVNIFLPGASIHTTGWFCSIKRPTSEATREMRRLPVLRTCNDLTFFWPTMDLAEIKIYGGLIFALSHEHVFELTMAYAVT